MIGTGNPLLIVLIVGVSLYLFILWLHDLRTYGQEESVENRLPGATPAGWLPTAVAVAGALILLGAETGAEYAIDGVSHQTDITVIYLALMVAAAFTEELIFRGYVVVTGKGRVWLVGSIVAASLAFALLHPYMWEWTDGGFLLRMNRVSLVTTGAVLAKSLWFYTVRFFPLNPARSLLPCIAAHLASNVGVFVVKFFQGHVVGFV